MSGTPASDPLTQLPHQRLNLLTNSWVLVCPNRVKRPWQGHTSKPAEAPKSESLSLSTPEEKPVIKNPLCPGATRANGKVNPDYEGVYVFENDFPALMPVDTSEPAADPDNSNPLFQSQLVSGKCHVMCFHPSPELTVAVMSHEQILAVVNKWCELFSELARDYAWVQIFENKGAIMGCSNPHPHCQVWSSSFVPNEARVKDACQREYLEKHGKNLLLDYAAQELQLGTRVVVKNDEWVAVVPYWAVWPFETLVIPLTHVTRLDELSEQQRTGLADIMKRLTTRYDNLFECSFPYSMGFHNQPTGPGAGGTERAVHWQLHAAYYPPLLRSASVQKFMVGYELLAQAQRDITPEQAADMLRAQSELHYTEPR